MLGAVLITLLGACGGDEDDAAGGGDGDDVAQVVTTTGIWADVVSNVACGDQVEVVSLLPAGGDPHTFEPSMADRAQMQDAALVVANGLGLEAGLDDTLDEVERSDTAVFRVGEHVETIAVNDAHTDASGAGDEHSGEGADPHIWQDPQRVMAALPSLADALVEDAGLDRVAVEDCVRSYTAELTALDEEVEALTSSVPAEQRTLVTNHDALGYFADRYDFEVLGTVIPGPATLSETNPADIEELAQAIEEAGVPAIFAETQHSDSDVRALADRVGDVEVVTLFTDSLGEQGSGALTYAALVRSNGELIAEALGARDAQG